MNMEDGSMSADKNKSWQRKRAIIAHLRNGSDVEQHICYHVMGQQEIDESRVARTGKYGPITKNRFPKDHTFRDIKIWKKTLQDLIDEGVIIRYTTQFGWNKARFTRVRLKK